MSKSFTLEQLSEGIRGRDVGAENSRLVEKWSRTGLLRGLEGTNRENMARLLENQTANLLRESNSLSTGGGSGVGSGDIRGFSNIAFPIVRRVFGDGCVIGHDWHPRLSLLMRTQLGGSTGRIGPP